MGYTAARLSSLNPAQMLNWQQINTVFLDMDGTLLDLYFDNHFWLELVPVAYADKNGLSKEEGQRIIRQKYACVAGTLDWYCVDYWTRELDLDIAALKRQAAHFISVHPYVRAFLEKLRQHGKQVWLVTNAHHKSLHLKMGVTMLECYFDDIICSHDYRVPKEESEFWERLQQAKPYHPHRTLLVEDSVAVLASARRYGIRHLLAITRPDSRQQPRKISDYPAVQNFYPVIRDMYA